MEMRDLCRRLRPVLGEKADRYWLAYLSDDTKGRQELEVALRLLAQRVLGSELDGGGPRLSVLPASLAAGNYPLGSVSYAKRELHPFALRDDELIQHTAIFGRSGAGKTNTVLLFIESLLARGKPFLIFDWKRNYRDLLETRSSEIRVFTVGRDIAPLSFNPLIPPAGTDTRIWLKKLIEIIAHSYYLGEGVMYLLQEALDCVYREHGVYESSPGGYPTFRDVLDWLERHPVRGRKALWMDSTLRAVHSICFGHMGTVVNTTTQPNLAALLEENVILELDSLTSADKTLVIESLLLWTHHYRLAQPDRETFKHAMIIEEAHHVLLKRTGAGSGNEALTDTILREIRELGEAIILVDQHPSLISIPALGNTYTTIALNTKHRSDVNALAGAMLLSEDQREVLGQLPIGTAVVKLQGRWLEPFLVKLPHRPIRKGVVNDEVLRRIFATDLVEAESPEVVQSPEPSDDVDPDTLAELPEECVRFLESVAEEPLLGTVQRYRRLRLSRRKGNTIRESCQESGIVRTVDIPTASGKVVLVELTDAGRHALERTGTVLPPPGREGLEHAYWKHQVADALESSGWEVKLEVPVNGFTDVIAKRDGFRLAVEVETGKSDWKANAQKNVKKGFDRVVLAATNSEALERIVSSFSEGLPDPVRVEPVQRLVRDLRLAAAEKKNAA